jgi:hypothetical protein
LPLTIPPQANRWCINIIQIKPHVHPRFGKKRKWELGETVNNNGGGLIGGELEPHAFHYLAKRVGISSDLIEQTKLQQECYKQTDICHLQ